MTAGQTAFDRRLDMTIGQRLFLLLDRAQDRHQSDSREGLADLLRTPQDHATIRAVEEPAVIGRISRPHRDKFRITADELEPGVDLAELVTQVLVHQLHLLVVVEPSRAQRSVDFAAAIGRASTGEAQHIGRRAKSRDRGRLAGVVWPDQQRILAIEVQREALEALEVGQLETVNVASSVDSGGFLARLLCSEYDHLPTWWRQSEPRTLPCPTLRHGATDRRAAHRRRRSTNLDQLGLAGDRRPDNEIAAALLIGADLTAERPPAPKCTSLFNLQ